jgi:hypothetical protein
MSVIKGFLQRVNYVIFQEKACEAVEETPPSRNIEEAIYEKENVRGTHSFTPAINKIMVR